MVNFLATRFWEDFQDSFCLLGYLKSRLFLVQANLSQPAHEHEHETFSQANLKNQIAKMYWLDMGFIFIGRYFVPNFDIV